MKESVDFFMIVGFVLFLTYLMRGFMLQVKAKEDERNSE